MSTNAFKEPGAKESMSSQDAERAGTSEESEIGKR